MESEKPRRQRSFLRELVPGWRPSRNQWLWTIRIVFLLVVLLGMLTLIGLPFGISLWDWLRVLAVPITIGAAVPLINWLQKRRELEFEEQRARTDALLQFLEQLTQLLLDKQDARLVKMKVTDDIREVISARTEAIGSNLDPQGNQRLTNFLIGLKLLHKENPIISLAGRNFSGIDWRGADLSQADLGEVDLTRADLQGANLQGADLQGANLQGAYLQRANLQQADLQFANLQQANLLHAILQPSRAQGANLQGANLQGAYLHGANLQQADLQEVNLQRARLQEANLQEANLQVADLRVCDVQRADLQRADLRGANLQRADLREANLRGANLQRADLQFVFLQRVADLTQGQIEQAFGNERTLLPEDINRPEAWSKSIKEQREILQERIDKSE